MRRFVGMASMYNPRISKEANLILSGFIVKWRIVKKIRTGQADIEMQDLNTIEVEFLVMLYNAIDNKGQCTRAVFNRIAWFVGGRRFKGKASEFLLLRLKSLGFYSVDRLGSKKAITITALPPLFRLVAMFENEVSMFMAEGSEFYGTGYREYTKKSPEFYKP